MQKLMTAIQASQPAPDFSLLDLDGQPHQLVADHNKPVVLNFFSTNCTWCQVELPKLAAVYRRLENVDAQILGVAVGTADADHVKEFASEKQLDFPIVLDTAGQARLAYGLERVPTVIVINPAGEIERVYQGSSEQLAGIVEQTVLAVAGSDEAPDFSLIGNGCSPEG